MRGSDIRGTGCEERLLTGDGSDPGTIVLVTAPATESAETDSAIDRRATHEEPVVIVAFEHSSNAVLETWRSRIGRLPSELTLVSVGEMVRSAAVESSAVEVGGARVLTVGGSDLTDIEMAVSDALANADGETEPIVRIDSLGPLLDSTGIEQAFRLLHILAGHVRRANAVAYCGLDLTAYGPRTVTALEPVFDGTIDVE